MRSPCMVALVVLLFGCGKEEKAAPEPPAATQSVPCHEAGKSFMSDVTAGRYEDAYRRTCSAYRAMVSVEQFSAAAKNNAYFKSGMQLSAGSKTMGCSSSGNVGRWDVYFDGPHKTMGEMYFTKEGETWCIAGMNVGGMPGLPLPPTPPAASGSAQPK